MFSRKPPVSVPNLRGEGRSEGARDSDAARAHAAHAATYRAMAAAHRQKAEAATHVPVGTGLKVAPVARPNDTSGDAKRLAAHHATYAEHYEGLAAAHEAAAKGKQSHLPAHLRGVFWKPRA